MVFCKHASSVFGQAQARFVAVFKAKYDHLCWSLGRSEKERTKFGNFNFTGCETAFSKFSSSMNPALMFEIFSKTVCFGITWWKKQIWTPRIALTGTRHLGHPIIIGISNSFGWGNHFLFFTSVAAVVLAAFSKVCFYISCMSVFDNFSPFAVFCSCLGFKIPSGFQLISLRFSPRCCSQKCLLLSAVLFSLVVLSGYNFATTGLWCDVFFIDLPLASLSVPYTLLLIEKVWGLLSKLLDSFTLSVFWIYHQRNSSISETFLWKSSLARLFWGK